MDNLTFISNGVTQVTLNKVGSPTQISLQYSTDGTNWSNYTVGEAIPLQNNQFVSFSGANEKFSLTNAHYYNFSAEGEGTLSLSGDVMSLVSGTSIQYPYAFCKLFLGNDRIVDASNMTLSAENISKWCYASMFKDCVNLSSVFATLPANIVRDWSYTGMFAGCTNLSTAPTLPATTLGKGCYQGMFYNCKNLTGQINLDAHTLEPFCYDSMFWGCEKLNGRVRIGASFLEEGSCANMFTYCNSLTGIMAFWGDWDNEANSGWDYTTTPVTSGHCKATNIWNLGVPSTLINGECNRFECIQELFDNVETLSYTRSIDTIPLCCWQINYSQPLIFKSTGATQIALNKVGTPYENSFRYKINNNRSRKYTIGDVISLKNGDILCFRGDENHLGKSNSDFYKFSTSGTGTLSLSGTLYSLNRYAATWDNFAFRGLFSQCNNIVDASNLYIPSTKMSDGCFKGMFWNCTNLTGAPKLRAMDLAPSCYMNMYQECTALTAVPDVITADSYYQDSWVLVEDYLPATGLADSCYKNMFMYCTSIVKPNSRMCGRRYAKSACEGMFKGCTSLTATPHYDYVVTYISGIDQCCFKDMFYDCHNIKGTRISIPFGISTIPPSCCYNMFYNCYSLTTNISFGYTSRVLGNSCFAHMFQGCSSLVKKPQFNWDGYQQINGSWTPVSTTLGTDCCWAMFRDCTSLTAAPDLPVTSLAQGCYKTMFQGCTSLTASPYLPATTLSPSCYQWMFNGCTSLKQISANFTTWGTGNNKYTYNWVGGVPTGSTGHFYKPSSLSTIRGASNIPSGWTVHNK